MDPIPANHHHTNPTKLTEAPSPPLKPHSATNGVSPHTNIHGPVTYKDCLKNHAASLGGYAVDGCGEFMASPSSSQSEPASLTCAACGCHRNFHRRDPEEPSTAPNLEFLPYHRHLPPAPSPESQSPSAFFPANSAHMLLALSAGLPTAINATPTAAMNPSGRKRFRTKFSVSQKEGMFRVAERLGWKMVKKDDDGVRRFCDEIGVERSVFKVWMHNNKNSRDRNLIQNQNTVSENSQFNGSSSPSS